MNQTITANQMRTCSEICIDADNHKDDLEYLDQLRKEIIGNIYDYPLIQLQYMKEHLDNLVKELARSEAAEFKRFLSCFGL